MTTPRAILLAVLLSLAVLAVPAAASAATYCVSDPDCIAAGGTDEGADVQKALDDAKGTPGLDHVQIGSGTFSAGPYAYSDGSAGNGVEIVGAGHDQTQLSAPPSTAVLTVAGSVSKVTSLGLAASESNSYGLKLSGASEASDLNVTSGSVGVSLYPGAKLTGSTVTLPVQIGGINEAVLVAGGAVGPTLVADDVLTGERAVEAGSSAGSLTIRRVRALGQQTLMFHCGQMTVEDSVIDTHPLTNEQGLTVGPVNNCGTDVTVRHSTIIGHGRANSSGAFAFTNSVPTSIALHDTIVSGFAHDLKQVTTAGGPATLTTDFSAYDPSTTLESGAGSITATNPLPADPRFVDPAGDYRLRDDSPLIDAGDPAGLAAGESDTDLAGNPRVVDALGSGTARSDLGAFEHDIVAPSTQPGGPAETAAAPAGDSGQAAGGADPAPPVDQPVAQPDVPVPAAVPAKKRCHRLRAHRGRHSTKRSRCRRARKRHRRHVVAQARP